MLVARTASWRVANAFIFQITLWQLTKTISHFSHNKVVNFVFAEHYLQLGTFGRYYAWKDHYLQAVTRMSRWGLPTKEKEGKCIELWFYFLHKQCYTRSKPNYYFKEAQTTLLTDWPTELSAENTFSGHLAVFGPDFGQLLFNLVEKTNFLIQWILVELHFGEISWFASVSLIDYLPQPWQIVDLLATQKSLTPFQLSSFLVRCCLLVARWHK